VHEVPLSLGEAGLLLACCLLACLAKVLEKTGSVKTELERVKTVVKALPIPLAEQVG